MFNFKGSHISPYFGGYFGHSCKICNNFIFFTIRTLTRIVSTPKLILESIVAAPPSISSLGFSTTHNTNGTNKLTKKDETNNEARIKRKSYETKITIFGVCGEIKRNRQTCINEDMNEDKAIKLVHFFIKAIKLVHVFGFHKM